MPHAPLKIAIIGSGPSGCYLAQALLRALPGTEIVLFDRRASPFGLVRYGVAADHQHTKAITRQFDRLFREAAVRFAGNVSIGSDVPLSGIRSAFDVVVLASGLGTDRGLGIEGAALPGVIGAGALIGALNADPFADPQLPGLGDEVVIIGAGNVAIDVLRFLVKDRAGHADGDIADSPLGHYLAAPATRITLASRSSAAEARCDPQLLRELAALRRARYRCPGPLPEAEQPDRTRASRVAALNALIAPDRAGLAGPEVVLRFGISPRRILGTGRVTGVEFSGAAGTLQLPADSVITAIGFEGGDFADLTASPSATGRLERGLYRTGWAKRGPRGAIPDNRSCAQAVATEILDDLARGALRAAPERGGFAALPAEVRAQAVDYTGWLGLEARERSSAHPGRARRKIPDHRLMVAIAHGDDPGERGASSPAEPVDRAREEHL